MLAHFNRGWKPLPQIHLPVLLIFPKLIIIIEDGGRSHSRSGIMMVCGSGFDSAELVAGQPRSFIHYPSRAIYLNTLHPSVKD
jgi:hypothetical protein